MPKKKKKSVKAPAEKPAKGAGTAAKASAKRKATGPRRSAEARARSREASEAKPVGAKTTTERRPPATSFASTVIEPKPGSVGTVVIRGAGTIATVAIDARLDEAAMRWNHVLRNRRRWVDSDDVRDQQGEAMRETLVELGFDADAFAAIVEAGAVEISIPYASEAQGWSGRIFPWEYALSAATTPERRARHRAITVVRHLAVPGVQTVSRTKGIKRVLFVASAPGPLEQWYVFDGERMLVESSLSPSEPMVVLENPTLATLEAKIRSFRPQAIHVSGLDTHQARALLELPDPDRTDDGVFLADDQGGPVAVRFDRLADAFAAGAPDLQLVGFNIYNSAGRIAAMAVAKGVPAAVGFQDEIDDRLAELFFAELYLGWSHSDGSPLYPFERARARLADKPAPLRGTGVVLWGRTPWLGAETTRGGIDEKRKVEDSIREAMEPSSGPRAGTGGTKSRGPGGVRATTVSATATGKELKVQVEPAPGLNYSMLHNGRSLFRRFQLIKPPARMENVEVEVMLHTGADSFPYRRVMTLEGTVHDLSDQVRLPLVSALWRTGRESIQTSLTVKVAHEGRTVFLETFPISLLPPDEWLDSDTDRVWLPSFVLPRDEAVLRIIDAAQRYLMALADDRDVGFDGYQSIDPDLADPFELVDLQVRAIWCAIVHDFGLKYINPPPVASEQSQRLRSPGEIIDGGRGTCIDLALLTAACLEYVEIYPVVFLIEGHAFPGWWRSDEAHDAFRSAAGTDDDLADGPRAFTGVQRVPWSLGRQVFREIIGHIHNRRLSAIESTWLTSGGSFFEAVDEGTRNLRSRSEFDAMLDIMIAREHGVTPLPLAAIGEGGRS